MIYDPEERYQQQLKQQQNNPQPQVQTTSPQKPPSPGFLQSLIKAPIDFGTTIGTTGAALVALGLNKAGKRKIPLTGYSGEELSQAIAEGLQEKYKTSPVVKASQGKKGEAVLDVAKQAAGTASWAVPFGKGAGLASKVLLPGAAVGGLQSFSEGQNPVTGAISGAAGAGILHGGIKAIGLAGKGAGKVGTQILKSQYNVLSKDAEKLSLGETVKKLSTYGIKNIDDVSKVAPEITGDTGVITNLTRKAVSRANPVNLGGLSKTAETALMDEPLLSNSTKKNVQNVLRNLLTSTQGEKITGADPSKVFDAIQKLESRASYLKRGASDEAKGLSNVFKVLASDLKDRLFKQAGADNAITTLSQRDLAGLSKVSPLLAQEASQVKTVGELRSLAAPFVRGAQLAEKTVSRESNKLITMKDILAGGIGGFGYGLPGILAGALGMKVAETPVAKTIASNVLEKGGNLVSKAPQVIEKLPAITGQVGARVGLGVSGAFNGTNNKTNNYNQNNKTNELNQNVSPSDTSLPQISDQSQMNPYPLENMMADSQRDPKNADYYKMVYDEYQKLYPATKTKNLTTQAATNVGLAQAGLESLDKLETILTNDPNVLTKQLVPGQFFSREYAALAHQTADAILRARTGAQANEQEIKLYMEQFLPRFGDDQSTIQTKLTNLRANFNRTMQLQQSTTGSLEQILPEITGGQ